MKIYIAGKITGDPGYLDKFRGAALYGWHISGLKIYDKPRKLSEFTGAQTTKDGFEPWLLDRAPQSWRYVAEG